MGYDLMPRNKKIESITIGAFSWPIILQETGCGYLIGYGCGRLPATYVYQDGREGSPVSNDGYKVSAVDARAMHDMCMGYISVKTFINKEWEALDEEERKRQEEAKSYNGTSLYQPATGQKFLDTIEKFAKFAKESKGFSIH